MKPTQEQVIAWAQKVGLPKWYQDNTLVNESLVIQFATLVYEAGRESAKLDSIHTCHDQCQRPSCVAVREAYEAGRKDENEACASLEVHLITPTRDYTTMSPLDCYEAALMDEAMAFRAAIRARMETNNAEWNEYRGREQ